VPDVQVSVDAGAIRGLAARLDELGRGEMLRKVERAIKDAVQPLPDASRRRALTRLPRRGGLAARVASADLTVVPYVHGDRVGAVIMSRAGVSRLKDLNAINRGRVMHPSFGHRPWILQMVQPGWFTEPIKAGLPEVRAAVKAAVRDAIREV
jgi:hypothetical protein